MFGATHMALTSLRPCLDSTGTSSILGCGQIFWNLVTHGKCWKNLENRTDRCLAAWNFNTVGLIRLKCEANKSWLALRIRLEATNRSDKAASRFRNRSAPTARMEQNGSGSGQQPGITAWKSSVDLDLNHSQALGKVEIYAFCKCRRLLGFVNGSWPISSSWRSSCWRQTSLSIEWQQLQHLHRTKGSTSGSSSSPNEACCDSSHIDNNKQNAKYEEYINKYWLSPHTIAKLSERFSPGTKTSHTQSSGCQTGSLLDLQHDQPLLAFFSAASIAGTGCSCSSCWWMLHQLADITTWGSEVTKSLKH